MRAAAHDDSTNTGGGGASFGVDSTRGGRNGSKELFVKRLRGEERVTYAHPSLEAILGDSRGVCIFQEQVMQILKRSET